MRSPVHHGSSIDTTTAAWWVPQYAIRAERLAELGFATYPAYLDSPGWWERKQPVLNDAEGICDWCEEQVGRARLEVHHRHYDTLGAESRWDLRPLCPDCHRKAHGLPERGDNGQPSKPEEPSVRAA